jgi:uridine phosphorylase
MKFLDNDPRSVVRPDEMVRAFACRKGKTSGDLSLEEFALITFTPYDLKEWIGADEAAIPVQAWWERGHRLYRKDGWVAVQSAFGAPNAVMLLEELIAFGVKRVVYLGYCGSLQDEIKVGDVIVPTESIREEGTSYHYLPEGERSFPDRSIQGKLYTRIKESHLPVHTGRIWTTDAPYRETRAKVRRYGEAGILGVEMEMSAAFALGMIRNISVGGVLIVSDELRKEGWKAGFFSPEIKATRKKVIPKLHLYVKDLLSNVCI